jgi:dipeptidyl aminopeptidase/acylaminoacyl peptidase
MKYCLVIKTLGISSVLTLVMLATQVAVAQQQKPLSVKDAMKMLDLADLAPISLSRDGTWVAYTVEDNSRRETHGDVRYSYYTPTGAWVEALGCDVWITNTKTHESRNLTGGKGTSWDPVWSPDGKYIAFYSDRNGTVNLWLWDKQTDKMRPLSDAIARPDNNFQVPRWAPDSMHVLVKTLPPSGTVEEAADKLFGPIAKVGPTPSHDPNAATVTVLKFNPEEASSSAQVSSADGVLETPKWMQRHLADLTLIDVRSGKADHIVSNGRPLGYWISPNGQLLAWTQLQGQRQNTQQTIYDLNLVNLVDRSSKTLVSSIDQDFGIAVSWSPDSKLLAYTTSGQSAKGDAYLVNSASGETRLLTPGVHPRFDNAFRAPLWDSNSENLYFISSESYTHRGESSVWKASVQQTGLSIVAEIPTHTIREIISPSGGGRFWSPDGGRSLVVSTRDETTKREGFYQVDLDFGKASLLYEANMHLGDRFRADVTPDGKTFVYTAEDSQHPVDIWTNGNDIHHPQRISSINPQFEGMIFGKSQLIDYYSDDGEFLHGALLFPSNYKQGKRYPLIVYPYAGSFRSNSVFNFGLSGPGAENSQILATRGYAVLLPDTPVHTNSPMLEIAKSVIPAVDRVVELGIADPNRLGIMGHSYGGYSTLAVIVQNTRFKAAVDSAGMGDLVREPLRRSLTFCA